MSTDSLSEAREALRRLLVHGRTNEEWLRAEQSLARLDALPAPYRVESSGTDRGEWCYPDPREDGGDDA